MRYIDRLEQEEFESNLDEHFQKAEVINFDIINHCCRGHHLQNSEKFHKTIKTNNLKDFPKKEKMKTLSVVNRTSHSDQQIQKVITNAKVGSDNFS